LSVQPNRTASSPSATPLGDVVIVGRAVSGSAAYCLGGGVVAGFAGGVAAAGFGVAPPVAL